MTTHTIEGDTSVPFNINRSGDRWVLGAGKVIGTVLPAHESALYEAENYHDNKIVLGGHLKGGPEGEDNGIKILGLRTSVVIQSTGELEGMIALYAGGKDQSIVNHGAISSDGYAVTAVHAMQIENHGHIQGSTALNLAEDGNRIVNGVGGTISSTYDAVSLYYGQGSVHFTNHGLVEASYTAFAGGDGNDTVINDGIIKGQINLSAGNDRFDNRGGSVDHAIIGGKGNDVLITDDNAVMLSEMAKGGTDTVRSSVSYTLGNNIENLLLIGKAEIDATGNDSNNRLDGNAGNNALSGAGGKDHLDGHKGNDILAGGAGADTFVFAKGSGQDTIMDFEKGHDRIDLRGWDDVSSFADLKAHHLTTVGNDLLISATGDTLILKNFDKADLHAADFIF
ncbi:hypothetical protein JJB09_13830 [Rhizobium sp. KVB221]|uniref:Peptidase M10 serralysin C-terminal domain-containing protein n=1 Tax=Rhizobium setariae TaxID=2801340 RepID=A0A936YUV0_9HYPH|nr:hypothetical protein [Rhizobium setariae]MBL0373110.1 hypothetical protein [Rhizobium setariae]